MWIVIVECGFIFNTYSEFTMLAVVNNNHHNLSLPAPFLRRPHKANVLVCWAATWWLCTHQFLLHRSHCYSGRQHRWATRHFVDHREQGYHTSYMCLLEKDKTAELWLWSIMIIIIMRKMTKLDVAITGSVYFERHLFTASLTNQ